MTYKLTINAFKIESKNLFLDVVFFITSALLVHVFLLSAIRFISETKSSKSYMRKCTNDGHGEKQVFVFFRSFLTIYAIFMAAVWMHTVKWTIFALKKVKQMEAFLWVIPLSWYCSVSFLFFFNQWWDFLLREASSHTASLRLLAFLTHCIRKHDFFILSLWSATKKYRKSLIIRLKKVFIHKVKLWWAEKHEFIVHS